VGDYTAVRCTEQRFLNCDFLLYYIVLLIDTHTPCPPPSTLFNRQYTITHIFYVPSNIIYSSRTITITSIFEMLRLYNNRYIIILVFRLLLFNVWLVVFRILMIPIRVVLMTIFTLIYCHDNL